MTKVKESFDSLATHNKRLAELDGELESINNRIELLEVDHDQSYPELIKAYDKRRHLYRERAGVTYDRTLMIGDIVVASIEILDRPNVD